MTLDEIRDELENADGLPERALREAVTQASALAPALIALMGKATRGVFLMPRQENLLFLGLHAVAAAQEASVYRPLLELLRSSEMLVERLFAETATESATRLLLALFDGDADPLFAAVEDPATGSRIRWSLFQVIARLTWDGRIPRERTIDLLDRFDREEMAPPADEAWDGWQDAIMYLGLEELEPRVRQAWTAQRMVLQSKAEQAEWLKLFRQAVAKPDDPQRFVRDGLVPISDPVASLAWLARPEPAPKERNRGEPADPAEAVKLTMGELGWLADFLVSDQAPDTSMSLDIVDGFFTALLSGSETVSASAHLAQIWGDSGPAFDSPEQGRLVTELLTRHWDTIAARLRDGEMHPPLVGWGESDDPDDEGRGWAAGFAMALSRDPDAWAPVGEDEDAGALLGVILSLVADAFEDDAEPLSPSERREVVDALPAMTLALSRFRRHGVPVAQALPQAQEPVRVAKVGRNEPCPCGSGRKYKKCCGAPGAG